MNDFRVMKVKHEIIDHYPKFQFKKSRDQIRFWDLKWPTPRGFGFRQYDGNDFSKRWTHLPLRKGVEE